MNDPIFTQLQMAIFFLNAEDRPDLIAYKLLDGMKQFENVIPNISNFTTAFGEYAKVTSTNINISNKYYYISLSNQRLDLYYNLQPIIENNHKFQHEFSETSLHILKILEIYSIKRIGIVRTAFFEGLDCDEFIKNKFLNIEKESYTEFSMQFNKPSFFNEYKINKMTNIYHGEYNINGESKKGTFIYRDINNVPKDNKLPNEYLQDIFIYSINQNIMDM